MSSEKSDNPTPPVPRKVGNDGAIFTCPTCRGILAGSNLPTFPFCSDRCRMIDLGNWLDGKYAVSRPIDPSDPIEEMPRRVTPPPPPQDP